MVSTGEPAFSGSSELLSLFTPYAKFLSYLSDPTDTHGDVMLCGTALNGFMACHLTVSSMGFFVSLFPVPLHPVHAVEAEGYIMRNNRLAIH
jgi:hypothetical protein